jgi:hypothetical protein
LQQCHDAAGKARSRMILPAACHICPGFAAFCR